MSKGRSIGRQRRRRELVRHLESGALPVPVFGRAELSSAGPSEFIKVFYNRHGPHSSLNYMTPAS